MNLAPEIINILEQNTLISISFSWTKLCINHYSSEQHIPSIYLINDGTPVSLPPISGGGGEHWEQGATPSHPSGSFYHTIEMRSKCPEGLIVPPTCI